MSIAYGEDESRTYERPASEVNAAKRRISHVYHDEIFSVGQRVMKFLRSLKLSGFIQAWIVQDCISEQKGRWVDEIDGLELYFFIDGPMEMECLSGFYQLLEYFAH